MITQIPGKGQGYSWKRREFCGKNKITKENRYKKLYKKSPERYNVRIGNEPCQDVKIQIPVLALGYLYLCGLIGRSPRVRELCSRT